MKIYYSPSNKAFYSDEIISAKLMPSDVFEINEKQHKEMLYQLNMNNKDIVISGSNKISYVDRITTYTWDDIRAKRNKLLALSDHKVMPDYPSDKQVWIEYRQALRDITETFSGPNEVIWPEEPK